MRIVMIFVLSMYNVNISYTSKYAWMGKKKEKKKIKNKQNEISDLHMADRLMDVGNEQGIHIYFNIRPKGYEIYIDLKWYV